jgi:hypothetical protein
MWLYWGIGVRVREVYVDLENGFFSDFGVSTLYSYVVIVLIFLLQHCYFLTVVSELRFGEISQFFVCSVVATLSDLPRQKKEV